MQRNQTNNKGQSGGHGGSFIGSTRANTDLGSSLDKMKDN